MPVTPERPERGKEYVEPLEERDTRKIIDTVIKRLERDFPPGKTLRQFHAKMHGCVKGTFTVLPDIPPNFQHGFLVAGNTYDALIRFSNGSVTVVEDRKADLRGVSIKLLDVPGEMLVQDSRYQQSQDFLLVSYPTLMSPDVAGMVKNIEALCAGIPGMIRFALNPTNWITLYRTLKSQRKTGNMFSLTYYSVSPYRLGPPDQAVKYAIFPTTAGLKNATNRKDRNFLRERMKQDLAAGSVSFDFMIQLQEDPVTMPIEDVCVEWKSPWHKVAQIEIPMQVFDTPEMNNLGENLTFSPWHSRKENQPLGGINRARKAAYEAIGKFRIERNTQ